MSPKLNNNSLTINEPIPLQPMGVPADHVDPNHPHFPTDPEAQLPPRQHFAAVPCLSKKKLVLLGTLLVLGSLIAALYVGIIVGKKNGIFEPNTTPTSTLETVSVTKTVLSTSYLPVSVFPKPTTVTQVLSLIQDFPKPTVTVPFEAPVRPTMVVSTVLSITM
ncbi:hypothetical protein BDW02DRAFT_602201 [Decorospora gaudefroyi]|uniref:Uncharacterized protein n=1 Tax=Decorospora gaudefroyi TaxID=184978 RepID=A0A6A5JY48_9PLEO|nr:hypothetical protein BDW02DRAFT_602201 [Decorospora gaudefroyi]